MKSRALGGWAERLHPLDCFVKNTYELLSPVHELTAELEMTQHSFLTLDHKVERSVFGAGRRAVVVVVNRGDSDFTCQTQLGGAVCLPPYGLVVESRAFLAFHARNWNGLTYDAPVFFTVRSAETSPLERARTVRVYHGFGDSRFRWRGAIRSVAREELMQQP